jgi:dipeptidyl aminopeptidase/acylaminoacyl peptidase
MTAPPVTRFGPYELVSRLGAGGMGEVWRARDTRLGRDVAVKILPRELADNGRLKIRLEREARAISQLSHPHICTLYDVGEEGGTPYLVMELVDGETLLHRLARGPMPLADVLRYGAEIAGALECAHRAGIIHRDLKPANIMITKGGAKLLDFGLAKSVATETGSDSTTLQKGVTEEGAIVGTLQYMAPEQIEGVDADARTDIFALGAVLYEMTTGQPAFAGKTRTSVIAAIIGGQPPPVRQMQPLAPSALDHVITTCLEKERERRWQSAHDVLAELQWIAAGDVSEPVRAKRIPSAWLVSAAVLSMLVAAAAFLYERERTKPVGPIAFSIISPQPLLLNAAIAPDGQSIAIVTYAGTDANDGTLWIRRIGAAKPSRLLDAPLQNIFWSPDSKTIGYFVEGKLMKVAVADGHPEVVASIEGYGVSGAWSRNGDIVFLPQWGNGLSRVSASGGAPLPVTRLDRGRHETEHDQPAFLPDGEHFVFLARTIPDESNVMFASDLRGRFTKRIGEADAIVGVWKGWLLFMKNGAVYAQRLNDKTFELVGPPTKIVDDVRYSEDTSNALPVSVSADGAISYLPVSNQPRYEVGWYDDGGRLIEKLFDESGIVDLSLARDDSRVAMQREDPRKGVHDVLIRDLARGITRRLTTGLSVNVTPQWSPDGNVVFFGSDRANAGSVDMYSQSEDGVSPPRLLWKGGDAKGPSDISPDGSLALAWVFSRKTKQDIWIFPLTGGPPRPWLVTDAEEGGSRFSPDGKWVVYSSNESGRWEAYVAAFPDGHRVQVSTDGGSQPQWDYDGSRIIFQNSEAAVCAVSVKTVGGMVEASKPVVLFQKPKTMTAWWRSRTTKRFLCLVIADPTQAVQLVNYTKGWAARLR